MALLTAAALFQAVPSRADEPIASFVGPVQVTFAGTPDSTDPREFLKQIERTISVQETPIPGAAEQLSPPYANRMYNSLPFGNCGMLNTIGAALYSSLTGAPFRYRSTATHVATEVRLGGRFYVLDSYTGTTLIRADGTGLYGISELETDAGVWRGRPSRRPATLHEGRAHPTRCAAGPRRPLGRAGIDRGRRGPPVGRDFVSRFRRPCRDALAGYPRAAAAR